MSDRQQQDQSGNTAQFQAFAQRAEPEPVRRGAALPWIVGIAVVVVIGIVVAILVAS